jgi:hypothetical protein
MMIPLVSGSGRRLSLCLVKARFKARYCSRIVANPTGRVEFDSKGLTACTSVHLPPNHQIGNKPQNAGLQSIYYECQLFPVTPS